MKNLTNIIIEATNDILVPALWFIRFMLFMVGTVEFAEHILMIPKTYGVPLATVFALVSSYLIHFHPFQKA